MKTDLREIEKRLLAVLEKINTLLPENELHEMIELVQAGEPGIGFENLCTQFFEYDVEVPPVVLNELAMLGSVMGIQPRYWERLKRGLTTS